MHVKFVYINSKARYTRYKFCIQVSIQENLNSSLCIHDARNFDEYTQVLAGDTTNKMAFLGGEEGAALCIFLNADLNAKLVSCIPGLIVLIIFVQLSGVKHHKPNPYNYICTKHSNTEINVPIYFCFC